MAELIERIVAEYRQYPCLRLTARQAARLWTIEPAECEEVLNRLADAGCLYIDDSGQYALRTA